jgi:hypothetical protein
MAWTDLLNSNSRLAPKAMSVGPGGPSMTFPTVVGRVDTVEYSETLASWLALTSGITGTGGVIEFDDLSGADTYTTVLPGAGGVGDVTRET